MNAEAAIVRPKYISESRCYLGKCFPKAPAAMAPIILAEPINAMEKAPRDETELTPMLLKILFWGIGLHISVINAGK